MRLLMISILIFASNQLFAQLEEIDSMFIDIELEDLDSLKINEPENGLDQICLCLIDPEFPGGTDALASYIQNHINYDNIPSEAKGIVYVQFIIDEEGKVTAPEIVKGISNELDRVAIDVVASMPLWIPGSKGCKNVKFKYTLPVHFIPKA
ncbi:energy transducer TonB [Paracrocinitomix mangrovi]|uniref:energy transducer TonB n=1 Tax=Paracrocinitomix mangrovi TaxID=2862509 RepID=UPI001C8D84E7|nr:energy transducer TonB [Paracrocinitomix mangrovi]UKN02154.1 energy transducer TonB [Paracrocinitomix mangrovi]